VKTNPFEKFAKQTSDGVYHAIKWDVDLPDSLVYDLIEEAKVNISRKARLCLHPDPSKLLQFTYLAFASPYRDKIHSHPNRPEVIFPIFGSAVHRTFDAKTNLIQSTELNAQRPVAVGTDIGIWHSIELQSEVFVMLEIGSGPFSSDSTVFMGSN
jgi:cupin fold WbuC family metalloprotein